MTLPSLPAQGSPNWFPYAQGFDAVVRSGRLSDTGLRAAFDAWGGGTSAAGTPGLAGLPVLHPTPPTVTAGTGGETSAISGSVLLAPDEPNAITYFGTVPERGTTYPNYLGVLNDAYSLTSPSPWAAEFVLDTADATGRFEVATKGTGAGIRVLIRSKETGAWQYVTVGATFTPAGDGGWHNDLVTLGAAGLYTIRLEFDSNVIFFGLRVGSADSVSATNSAGKRVIVVGDSFTEPTIVDTGTKFSWDGWAQLASYVTGYDIWSAGSGGTGYVAPGSGGRVKFRDRLAADVIPYAPDEVWWFGGINDASESTSAVLAEAVACWAQVTTALPNCRQIVAAPFWKGGVRTIPASLLNMDAGLSAAAATAGLTYLPILLSPPAAPLTAPLAAAATDASTQLRVTGTSWPVFEVSYAAVDVGASGAEAGRVTNVSDNGDGTVTLTLDRALDSSHSVGAVVRRVGGSLVSGTGKQGATAGDGTADRFTGNDGTHPTKAGHRNITSRVFGAYREAS